jgi:hypothetical protein
MSHIIFQDTFSGFKHLPELNSDDLSHALERIQEGAPGLRNPSQNFMYFIYKKHERNVPLLGLKFNVYIFVKAVAGSKVENPQKNAHQYALTHNSSTAWFFSDNMFE